VVLFKAIQQILLENEITIKNSRDNIKDFSDLWLSSSLQNTKLTKKIKDQDIVIKILAVILLLSCILFIYLAII
jgi:hypothetical protein